LPYEFPIDDQQIFIGEDEFVQRLLSEPKEAGKVPALMALAGGSKKFDVLKRPLARLR
jgi:hypothetical protein